LQTETLYTATQLHNWIKKELIQKKFMSPWGIPILLLMAVTGGYFAANDLFFVPIAFGFVFIGLVVLYFCLFKPLVGFYVLSAFSVFLFYPDHLIGRKMLPLNSVMEILILFLFLGTLISKQYRQSNHTSLFKTFVGIMLLLNTVYVTIEVFNPNTYGTSTWFAAFKRSLVFVMLFAIAYNVIDSIKKIRFFIQFWVLTAFVISLYGCYQQWFGYLPMEMNFIMNTPGEYQLLFQGGQMRKFSFLSDVVSFGVLAGSMSVFTIILAINSSNAKRKYGLFFFALIMMLGMAYSGTRTTTIIIPVGLALYGLITIQNKTTLITLFVGLLMAMVVLFAPIYNNPTLNRVRSTFDSKDESLNLRDRNRHYIQPYLYSHSIGGGIGTTNTMGLFSHPYHPLAGFPTDSGLLKNALELGWIGLFILMLFQISIFYQGIYYYFKMRNKELKLYLVMILATLFPIIVAQYSQETIGQFPGCIFFFCSISLMKRLLELDETASVKADRLLVPVPEVSIK
jgi:hypothetical protein